MCKRGWKWCCVRSMNEQKKKKKMGEAFDNMNNDIAFEIRED